MTTVHNSPSYLFLYPLCQSTATAFTSHRCPISKMCLPQSRKTAAPTNRPCRARRVELSSKVRNRDLGARICFSTAATQTTVTNQMRVIRLSGSLAKVQMIRLGLCSINRADKHKLDRELVENHHFLTSVCSWAPGLSSNVYFKH